MNRVRVIGLVVLAALAAWFVLRSCSPQTPAPAPTPPPAREAFHAAKPLHVEIRRKSADGADAIQHDWLEREIRHLLIRGKMKVAALSAPGTAPEGASGAAPTFTLKVIFEQDASGARLALIAPDGVQERSESLPVAAESQLAIVRSLAQRLPSFLGAPGGTADWSSHLGTMDAVAYEAFIRASDALLQADGVGFTAPAQPTQETVANLERIEKLTRRQREFARARALLSIAYLSVGGRDQASLAKLAETAAERALGADAQLADAHAALGIVRLRRMDWSAAQEHFDAALAIDASSVPALEGLGCLLMDVGHTRRALPIAARAASLQPGNRGARQCSTYASIAQGAPAAVKPAESFDVARIHATVMVLGGDRAGAEALLKPGPARSAELVEAVLGASVAKERVPEALQAITRAADDEDIDAESEMLFGAALRRPDFVFNRMLRLANQNEAVPLRMLWLPQTDFLRKHRRFREVVSAASLTTYWQDHGVPDICASEPKVPGCAGKNASDTVNR